MIIQEIVSPPFNYTFTFPTVIAEKIQKFRAIFSSGGLLTWSKAKKVTVWD